MRIRVSSVPPNASLSSRPLVQTQLSPTTFMKRVAPSLFQTGGGGGGRGVKRAWNGYEAVS
ncbi:hypothetical protein E2C01_096658 [Portunus trituberculatus]|uniref:Uncharacterized protein n=1 Tax=Portunus trituberculatus TaxID=210409 RepID=A0A5B7JYG9_PORTR|nr:hypothetical protein [Portunus trituberculatus]